MEELIKLKVLCDRFEAGDFSIEEFQGRLATVNLPDEYNRLQGELRKIDNELEEIRFCQLEEHQLTLAKPIVDKLNEQLKLEI